MNDKNLFSIPSLLAGSVLLALPTFLQAESSPIKTDVEEAWHKMESVSGGAVELVRSETTGLATFIATTPGKSIPTSASPTASIEERGNQFLTSYGKAIGIASLDQIKLEKTQGLDEAGMEHARYQQVHKGIPVRGGEVIVHLRGTTVTAVTAKTVPDINVDTTPDISSDEAIRLTREFLAKHLNVKDDVTLSKPQLEIFHRGLFEKSASPTQLSWFIEATRVDLREFIWIDAKKGALLLHFSQLTDAKSRRVYDAQSRSTLPGTLMRSEGQGAIGDTDVDTAYNYSGDTYDYFFTQHNRDSYDGAGAALISTVRFCDPNAECPYQNAFWNGSQMIYGQGFPAADDVVAHELTHAVTEKTAHLVYYMESGALNESFSDIFGETIDLTNTGGSDGSSVRWLMGEDVPGIGAIRNMMTPTSFHDPGKISDSEFLCGPRASNGSRVDHGGVHTNSGIPNHAYALMVDGGTYNGQTLSGIGLTKAGKIQYRALANYLVSTADFQANYTAVLQACTDLVGTASGITTADCNNVKKALDAVEMNSSTCSPVDIPPLCPTGYTPTNLYSDNFENITSGNWATSVMSGINHWGQCDGTPDIYCSFYPASGASHLWARRDSTGDSAVAMTQSIAIPSGTVYMQFNHAYDFEYDTASGANYDGGVVEYSTDGGTTWTDAGSLVSSGSTYGGTISNAYSNPLGGRNAFVKDSLGYTASQFNLSSLAGKSVRFGFRMGTDPSVSYTGWLIDDVRVYKCEGSTATSSLTISDVTQNEGNSGTTLFSFTVNLTPASTSTVTVNYATANNTATAGSDYTSKSGSLSFSAGQTSQTVTVSVNGDTTLEPDETFFVNLTNPSSGTTISDAQGVGTITNDDAGTPDFTVTDITLDPASPGVNGTFNATVTVKNQGAGTGTGGTLRLWANRSSTQSCSPTGGDQSITVGSLAAGASTTITVNNLPAGTAGTKTLRAFIDAQCQATESNESNNQMTKSYTVSANTTSPDFTVTDITLDPASPGVNGTFNATVTVKNQGTGTGTGGTLRLWSNQSSTQSCSPTGGDQSITVGSLAAGASTTITVNNLPAGTAGTKTLRAFIDAQCQATESNESNNQMTKSYTVSANTTSPDFTVTDITLDPASPGVNGTFNATVTVKNQGTGTGTGGTLRLWSNQSSTQSCSPTGGDQSITVGSLAAGASTTITVNNLPAGTAGTKTLRAFIDAQCQATESDENNNQITKSYTVADTSTGPDFVISAISLNPSIVTTARTTFSATITVTNQGNAAGNGGYLDVWSDQPNQQACQSNGNAYVTVGTLNAGESKTFTVRGLSTGSAGSKTLRAFVDSYCQASETVENNNQYTLPYTVNGGPDFVVTGVELTRVNDLLDAKVTVKNQGTASGDGGYLDLWLNQNVNTPLLCYAEGDAYVTVGALSAGESRDFTIRGLPIVGSGEKTFRAFVDSYCQTSEVNESNNQLSQNYTIQR